MWKDRPTSALIDTPSSDAKVSDSSYVPPSPSWFVHVKFCTLVGNSTMVSVKGL